VFLAIVKLTAFLMTGSVILLGSLLDSISDALISLVNYRVSRLARAAPDREHPFGHGGIEVASSLFQGIILAVFGVFLAGQSIVQMRSAKSILSNEREFIISLSVTLVAAFGGFLIQFILNQMQKNHSTIN
jgi:ferrous-iron efflux pump FieF